MNRFQIGAGLVLVSALAYGGQNLRAAPIQRLPPSQTQASKIPVVFSGGHETDPRDKGRPVVLIAAALNVPTDVFREAFSHVKPAPAGTQPDPDQVQQNKAALLEALSQYGVTNDRLDEVSNYYRYVRSQGEMWPVRAATGYAVVIGGQVANVVITDGGSGYCSPPTVTVPGITGSARGVLSFSEDFDTNGAVDSIDDSPPQ